MSCKTCSTNLKSDKDGFTTLKKHANSQKHEDGVAAVKIQSDRIEYKKSANKYLPPQCGQENSKSWSHFFWLNIIYRYHLVII